MCIVGAVAFQTLDGMKSLLFFKNQFYWFLNIFLYNAIFIADIYSTFKHATDFVRKNKAISDRAEKDGSLEVTIKALS